MIRRDRVDEAEPQPVPQRFLVRLFPQRGRHHPLCALEVRPLRVRLVEHEVRDHRLDVEVHAALLCGDRGIERVLARQMHDVTCRARHLQERREVVRPLGFDARRPARFVPLRSRLSLGDQLLAQLGDDLRVLAVRRRDHAELLGELQRVEQFVVLDAEEPLVRQKHFERRDPVIDDLAQLPLRLLVELRDRHVERVVAGTVSLGLCLPELVALQRIVLTAGARHLDI